MKFTQEKCPLKEIIGEVELCTAHNCPNRTRSKEQSVDVEFVANVSKADNCICNACFGKGQVIKIRLPDTRYHNGTDLETKYTNYWLCRSCRDKLVKALEWSVEG